MTKHEAMQAYFEPKVEELSGRMLKFNFSDDSRDSISFLTNYAAKVRKNYVRAAEKEYAFSILITKTFSSESDDLNLQAMNFAQSFMDWLDEQSNNRIYPDFGSKCEIRKIENLQNMPNLANVDWENQIAQYMLQCRVIYMEKK